MLACKTAQTLRTTNSIERSSELRSEILWRIAGAALSSEAIRGTYSRD
ncbi:MAG: hypothetical protein IJ137_08260 [Eubacterium sp.]|nr:hypothetical protein [Eubacterium sp.]